MRLVRFPRRAPVALVRVRSSVFLCMLALQPYRIRLCRAERMPGECRVALFSFLYFFSRYSLSLYLFSLSLSSLSFVRFSALLSRALSLVLRFDVLRSRAGGLCWRLGALAPLVLAALPIPWPGGGARRGQCEQGGSAPRERGPGAVPPGSL